VSYSKSAHRYGDQMASFKREWTQVKRVAQNASLSGGTMETMSETISDSAPVRDVRETVKYEAGNEADFERLYRTSYGKILGTVTAMLGDRAAAEDCTQDAFERAYKKWATWQPIAPAEAWVHRIAINAAVSHQRKMRLREVGEVIRRIGRPGLAPDPQVLAEHRDLTTALSKLPPKQAAAIVLRHYHGYTNRAIAQALGIPERTVASRLAVAKERLRVMLKHSYGPEAGIEEGTHPGLVAAAN
jgi:RNA polymerase sigma-70 factor (ECF subfamily)